MALGPLFSAGLQMMQGGALSGSGGEAEPDLPISADQKLTSALTTGDWGNINFGGEGTNWMIYAVTALVAIVLLRR